MTSLQLKPDKLFMGANGNADKNMLSRLLDKVDSPTCYAADGASKIAEDISKRIEDRKLIHENEERLRMAGESAELGTWEFHPVTKKMIWSDECKKIFGLPADTEPDSHFVAKHYYPEDKDQIQRAVIKAMHPDNDGNFKIEFRIIRDSDKELRWLKVQGKAYFDDNEKPQKFIGTMLDITEERAALHLIRESEERFKMAVESTGLFIVSEIIYRQKGAIAVKSEKGRESEFTINIPLDYRK